jgi:malate dehydrogenase (oxaloacetate-decarboxylating)(NADP+)
VRAVLTCLFDRALAATLSEQEIQQGRLFPSVSRIRDISLSIAVEVAKLAESKGLARRHPGEGES